MLFNWTFKLVEEKETDIMIDLVRALKAIPQDKENHSSSTVAATASSHVSS